MTFTLLKTSGKARRGRLKTLHGTIETPVFMPVGTQATVKSQTRELVKESGAQIVLANTYHLYVRPGLEVFEKFKGIHDFMKWDLPVLTDSGGYQVFSLPHARQMNEDGATFRSYLDGKLIYLTPEESIRAQLTINSDIMMAFDQCVASTCSRDEALLAMDRTHRWARRSLEARGDRANLIFGIVQGACFEDLRLESARTIQNIEVHGRKFDGLAIGGLAVGETRAERERMTEVVADQLPADRPRYLMGVGTPIDLLEAVARGVDMFDCIIPTAYAQRGVVFTSLGKVQLRRSAYRLSEDRLDPECPCSTCATYSLAYLHHLVRASEPLGWTLLSHHNLTYYHRLMDQLRNAIEADTFSTVYQQLKPVLESEDPRFPTEGKTGKSTTNTNRILGQFEVVVSELGHANVKSLTFGERMHSVSDPFEEAERLYLNGSGLKHDLEQRHSRLQTQKDVRPLHIWDVGLGAAANAMAALRAAESLGVPLVMVSFENDLDALKIAHSHLDRFKYLDHPAIHDLLSKREYRSATTRWTLLEGDLRERLFEAPPADYIFFDPFSQNVQPDLWTSSLFKRIFDHHAQAAMRFVTYSSSTAVRAGLLSAGFYVANGVKTGPKETTTLAFTSPRDAEFFKEALLPPHWLKRWERSDRKFPPLLKKGEHEGFEERLRSHAQFCLREP